MGNLSECNSSEYRRHPAYGYYHGDRTEGSDYVVLERRLEKNKKELEAMVIKLKAKTRLQHRNIVRLARHSWHYYPYCYKILLVYEYFPTTLAERWKYLGDPDEKYLWKMMDDVQSAIEYLARYSGTHSNISALTILYDEGKYMLTDNRLVTSCTAYEKALRGSHEEILSERLLEPLRNKSRLPNYTVQDDLFALGLLILSLATNTKVESFYDRYQLEIKKRVVDNKLRQMGKVYSTKLIKRIKYLLQYGMSLQSSTTTSLCYSLDTFNYEYSMICSKLKSRQVIDF